MKMVRKYMNMAFLLLSVASIIPAYGNEVTVNENQDKQEIVAEPKKTEKVAWYNREIDNKGSTIGDIVFSIGLLASFSAIIWYTGIWRGIMPIKQQEQQSHNRIEGVTVLGTITQTDGKNTAIITPGKKPVWVKQDNTGTWMKKDESSPWVLYDSTVLSAQ